MIRLSAFADEISSDLYEQIAALKREDIYHLDFRGVWNTSVLDLSNEQISDIKDILNGHDIHVAAIGSSIGKVPIDSDFDEHLQRFERAIAIAHLFETPYIRIFSFYPPAADRKMHPDQFRGSVIERLGIMIKRARASGITLLHENEKGIYGDMIGRCVDLMQSCEDTHFRFVLDPANFIQCGQIPYPDAYTALRPWLGWVHVKDALPDGRVVAAGEGVARWPDLLAQLRADGYDGFLSLEPHLATEGQFGGFSGLELFEYASQALQGMLRTLGWTYS
jgi:sugar phosphate isomerase/epimerase